MRYVALILLIFAFCFRASASTILISDIDDTVRQTNVRNLQSMTVLKNIEFAGLAKLYSHFERQRGDIDYVTGNPNPLKALVQYFLQSNFFPNGEVFTRDSQIDTVTHKVKTIEAIISSHTPDHLIMIGDNGEQDGTSYDKIDQVHPGLSVILIHQLYDDPINPKQTPWISSIDLAMLFYSHGWIQTSDFDDVLNYAVPMLDSTVSQEQVFPSWIECKSFYKNYLRPAAPYSADELIKIQKFETFIARRCS